MPPPVPPAGTADEFFRRGTPIGLGYRVPMIIASPWTRDGWVDSQTYDRTSVIRLLSDCFNQVAHCNGWYDCTITVSGDSSWSRPFAGHTEIGTAGVSG